VTVLVFCEDDLIIQKLIRLAMRALPHVVHIVDDGEDGLALIERERPAAVFTDMSMPRMDGLQLLDILQLREDLRSIPVVLMTASVQRAEIEDALHRGAADVLVKPFGPTELRAKVEEVLAKTRSFRT